MKVEIRRQGSALGECQEPGVWDLISQTTIRVWVAPGGHFRDIAVPEGLILWIRNRQEAIPADYRMILSDLPESLKEIVDVAVEEARQRFSQDCAPDVPHPWDDHGTLTCQ